MGKHIQHRLIHDPSMTDSEFYAQQRDNPTKPNIGKHYATENAMTRIGALCFIRRRLHHHEIAAERFKNLYEARYGVGSPALDASRVQVDTSPIAHDAGMAGKIDRTNAIREAETFLGKDTFDRLVACLVLGIPAGDGMRWRQRMTSVGEVLDALDSLSTHWGYRSKAA
jgi:hypothetical protein